MIQTITLFFTKNIKRTLMSGVIFVHVSLISLFIFHMTENQKNFLQIESILQTKSLAKTLSKNATSWVLANDFIGMEEIISSIKDYPNIQYAMLVDFDGKVLAHTEKKYLNSYVVDQISEKLKTTNKEIILIQNGQLIDIATPIVFGSKHLGWARVAINQGYIQNEINNIILKGLFYLLIAILVGWIFALLMARKLIDTIFHIRAITHKISDGEWNQRITIQRDDEMGVLIRDINGMLDRLQNKEDEIFKINSSLKESELRWKFAIEGNGDGLWDWNIRDNSVFFSPQWKFMLGYGENEIVNRLEEWEKRVHPDDLPSVSAAIQKHLANITTSYRSEHRVLCKNGEYKWILDRGIIVKRDEDGQPLRMIGTHTDIDNHKKAEQLILTQKKELETIFETTNDGIAIIDLQTQFKDCNKAFLQQLDYSKEELLQLSCFDIVLPQDKEKIENIIQKSIELGFVSDFEVFYVTKSKNKILVNMSVSIMPDKKQFVMTVKDITKNKLFEEQARLASMGEMIGNIAHQWRQPLSVISTTASGIQVKQEYGMLKLEQLSENMEHIISQVNYLSHTIDDFRNFIKNDQIKSPLSVVSALNKTFSIIEASLKNNYIHLIKKLDDDITIDGYENELIQTFINILNNAKDVLIEKIENEEDRFIFIETNCANGQFNILIKDTAGGIPDTVLPRIFEPYFTTKHQSIGTGLGLSIAYKIIIEHHNGTIQATNDIVEYNQKMYRCAQFLISFPVEETIQIQNDI